MSRHAGEGVPDAPRLVRIEADRVISVRQVRPHFDNVPDRLWFGGNRFRTAFFNAYTLLLCEECEFVAIVHKYLPAIRDEKLRVQAKSWLGQEASHGVQHRKACVTLERLGLRYRVYQRVINFVSFRMLFPVLSKSFRISLVAGLEHFNTMIGEMCLTQPDYFANVDEELALLLSWHFAEEIEHRAVIHDIAEEMGVGYFTRVIAGFFAFALYTAVLLVTACWFSMQSPDIFRPAWYRQLFQFLFKDEKYVRFSYTYLRAYLARAFHPLLRRSDQYAAPVFSHLDSAYQCRRS